MTPTVAAVEVVPVAGHDAMLLNLSGAHGPCATRNIALLTDSDGRVGLGEVPGGDIQSPGSARPSPRPGSGFSGSRSPASRACGGRSRRTSPTATPAGAACRPSTAHDRARRTGPCRWCVRH